MIVKPCRFIVLHLFILAGRVLCAISFILLYSACSQFVPAPFLHVLFYFTLVSVLHVFVLFRVYSYRLFSFVDYDLLQLHHCPASACLLVALPDCPAMSFQLFCLCSFPLVMYCWYRSCSIYTAAQPQLVFHHVVSIPVLQQSAKSSTFTLPWLPSLPGPCRFASISPAFLSPCWFPFIHQPSGITFQLCSTFNCQLFHRPGLCHIYLPTSVIGSGCCYSCCPSPYSACAACSCHVLSVLSSVLLPIGPWLSLVDTLVDSLSFCCSSLVVASSAFSIPSCSSLLISCPQVQCLSLDHIYLPPSVSLVQTVVILAAHHLIPLELPAPAMSSPSSFLCCPLVLCYLCLTPRLISQCLCWCILSIVLVWCFVNSQRLVSTKFPLSLGVQEHYPFTGKRNSIISRKSNPALILTRQASHLQRRKP